MTDFAALYAEAKARIAHVVSGAGGAEAVPACPGWTVADLVGHLAAVGTDVGAGRVEGAATDAWTARQVEERKGRTVAENLEEWETSAPALEPLFATRFGGILVADVTQHEQDLRGALGVPGARTGDHVDAVMEGMLASLDERVRATGLPALRVRAGSHERVVGEGEPSATLTVEPWELLRALFGRRSRAQVRSYDWDGDPEPWMGVLFVFGPRDDDLEER